MIIGPRAIAFVGLIFVASCGGETSGITTNGVTGAFTVITDVPSAGNATGASYRRSGGFTSAQPTCTTKKMGTCDIDPCYVSALIADGSALVSAGPVAIVGADLSSDALAPQASGAYGAAVVDSQIPWTTGGESVTIQWAHFPGDASQSGGQLTLGTPPYIALQGGSAFADATSTLTRDHDLTVSWTSDSAPGTLDRVNVDLRSGSTEIDCTFDAAAGSGVVPAGALQALAVGPGTFDVHSKEYVSQKLSGAEGATWTLQFNVDAHARTTYGLAKGSIAIE